METELVRHRPPYRSRSIVRDDAEAEDMLQGAYLHGFSNTAGFPGETTPPI